MNLKKIFPLLLLFMMPFFSFGQEKITTFKMGGIENHFYISATKPNDKGNFEFYILPISLHEKMNDVALIIESQRIKMFKNVIKEAKYTYSKYKNQFNEDTLIKFDVGGNYKWKSAFKNGKKWIYDYKVELSFAFVNSTKSGSSLYILNKNDLKGLTNKNLICDGFIFSFKSKREINNFISKLSIDKVTKYYKK